MMGQDSKRMSMSCTSIGRHRLCRLVEAEVVEPDMSACYILISACFKHGAVMGE